MKTAVIIPAAGTGSRMNRAVAKQYLPIGGRPILARTLRALAGIMLIDEIFLVLDVKEFDYFEKEIMPFCGNRKPNKIVKGGSTRQESVYNGLKAAGNGFDIILIHDAVRPFIDEQTVLEIIAQAASHGAAAAAGPVTDTIKKADEEGFIIKTVPREHLWAVQTPQGFSREVILRAHKKASEEGFQGTDDASLVERLGKKVKIVECSRWNLKITTAEDLVVAEGILREIES
jgi:2-C-methyl-D-erythritol 4-phosphate cytidylyltransferase